MNVMINLNYWELNYQEIKKIKFNQFLIFYKIIQMDLKIQWMENMIKMKLLLQMKKKKLN